MPSWKDVLKEIQKHPGKDALDAIRRKYLIQLFNKTGRNVIAYYSGWLQKPGYENSGIIDDDKNGFMATIHQLDRSKGLDLILHTPGGNVAATESLVNYLHKMFGNNIRAIVPQLALSAGTMMACACNEIVMGKQSSIGPIDPQIGGVAAHSVIIEFERALTEIQKNPKTIPIWQVIVGKYHPTFIIECENAMKLSEKMVTEWLEKCMFAGDAEAKTKASDIVSKLNNHVDTMLHERHIPMDEARNIGLKISSLEQDLGQELQELILTVHHAYMHTFAISAAVKIIENHTGSAVIHNLPIPK